MTPSRMPRTWGSSFSRGPCRMCALVELGHYGTALTCCSGSDAEPMYNTLLEPLVNKFTRTLFNGARYIQRTYVAKNQNVFPRGRGVVAVQYTPYDHNGDDDECTPQAKVRMFYEDNKTPVIDKTWDATSSQVNSKRRRDTSCRQLAFASSEHAQTTNRSQVETEIGPSQRAMSPSETALPPAWVQATPPQALAALGPPTSAT